MYQNIAKLLAEKGKTQKALAEAIGVSTGNVSDWKKGRAKPTTEVVVKIAQYFGVSVDYLLGVSEIRNTETLVDIYKVGIDAWINDKAFTIPESHALRKHYLEMLFRYKQLLVAMSNAVYRKERKETLHEDAVNIAENIQKNLHETSSWVATLPLYFSAVTHETSDNMIKTTDELQRISGLSPDEGLSEDEQDLLEMFHNLDKSGRRMVLATLEAENRRVNNAQP